MVGDGRAHALKFDGEAYWEAMLKAIDVAERPGTLADLYGELALVTTLRGAMWKRFPDHELVAAGPIARSSWPSPGAGAGAGRAGPLESGG